MTILEEYTSNMKNKNWNVHDLEKELHKLIKEYNELRDTNLLVYVSLFAGNLPTSIDRNDYNNFVDLLDNIEEGEDLDLYLETPGGDITTVEDIIKYIQDRYNKVSFVIGGQAKSAGTIMTLGADEILMTKTGALGPIDAQIISNGTIVSAFDYIQYINEKQKEAEEKGELNPVDKEIIGKISPGQINGVMHTLEYSKELAEDYIYEYNFKNIKTKDKVKKEKAKQIAETLSDHNKWKTHDRNIKIDDLKELGLEITSVEEDDKLKDLVYRINLVCRLIFNMSNNYKMFYTEKGSLVHSVNGVPNNTPQNEPASLDINCKCDLCEREYTFYAKLVDDPNIDKNMKKQGKMPFPKNNLFKCKCGSIMNLKSVREEIETNFGKKML